MTDSASTDPLPLPAGKLSQYPWITFLLPFVVYMVIGTLEPRPPGSAPEGGGDSASWYEQIVPYDYYPWVYTAKIVLTVATMMVVLPGYRSFRWRLSPLSFAVGGLGGIVWITLSELHLEAMLPATIVDFGARSAYNPLEYLGSGPGAYAFLAVRFLGLIAVVSIIEEFFLRGFVMRYLTDGDWWTLGFHQINRMGIIAGTVLPMLTHPAEMVAALVWFSTVTWLMFRTRNIWDCVAAHAITNAILGAYVVTMDRWHLM